MSKINNINPPAEYDRSYFASLMQSIAIQLNGLSEGRLAQRYATSASIPTTGDFAQGDIVWDSAPAEAGAGGAKYVRIGWICTVGGTPGTLLPMRVLTGN